jgi:hypothetical protein
MSARGAPLCVAVLLLTAGAQAAHPLLTEDTGTQGADNFQLELMYERFRDQEAEVHTVAEWAAAVLAYGVRDDLDVIVTFPYGRIRSDTPDVNRRVQGTGDMGLDLKGASMSTKWPAWRSSRA